jgi:predicted pyridoxine 5'-phosphate oxidase superfamily flavin-nucleotide-binding protein
MSRAFSDIAFTPNVRALQARHGSRNAYAKLDHATERGDRLGPQEAAFVAERDSFYLATVGENGWPYVQHRGGPAGFLKVLGPRQIGYADFSGNKQYISTGNLQGDDRVSLFLMDYAEQRRLKLWGRAHLVEAADAPELLAQLTPADYRVRIERGVIIEVEAFDWNCPQHITPRFTEAQIDTLTAPLRAQLAEAREQLAALGTA